MARQSEVGAPIPVEETEEGAAAPPPSPGAVSGLTIASAVTEQPAARRPADTGLVAPFATPQSGPSAEEIANNIYERVRHTFGQQITPENVMVLVLETMAASEKVGSIPGPKRKSIATAVVHRLLDEIPEDAENRDLIIGAVKLILPGAIDAIISAAKGQVELGRKVKKACSGFFCC